MARGHESAGTIERDDINQMKTARAPSCPTPKRSPGESPSPGYSESS
jgi:hypothetical protein